jgi:putative pyruvate formate lyase activating enzyme
MMLERCEVCPRLCRVDRAKGERGFCKVGNKFVVAHYGPHFGEEPPISGERGSGNIFFSSCNLRCVFCQNFQISHELKGEETDVEGIVRIFFELESALCHNINLVSPTPYIPLLREAIRIAKDGGLKIPIVYNSNAYENVEALRMLEGLVDIYLPDFKYWNGGVARRLSFAEDYPLHARRAILEMARQVGNLVLEEGIARRGLLIRHLVLPSGLSGAKNVLRWIKEEIGADTYVSLMAQYYPTFRAFETPMLRRRITQEEYEDVLGFALCLGLKNIFVQELESALILLPDFDNKDPFRAAEGRGLSPHPSSL